MYFLEATKEGAANINRVWRTAKLFRFELIDLNDCLKFCMLEQKRRINVSGKKRANGTNNYRSALVDTTPCPF